MLRSMFARKSRPCRRAGSGFGLWARSSMSLPCWGREIGEAGDGKNGRTDRK